MERIAVIGFTGRGCLLALKLSEKLKRKGMQVSAFAVREAFLPGASCEEPHTVCRQVMTGSLTDWTGEMFRTQEAILFVGACGIAVRSIAPFLKSKWEDPAVLVADELGRHVIPILSGHVGGANALACCLAELLGAEPVLTTATDVNGHFAVDVFAGTNGLVIEEKELAREASARILSGERLAFFSELPVIGLLPPELYRVEEGRLGEEGTENYPDFGICVTKTGKNIGKRTLHLYPSRLYVGIGCRRCTPKDAVSAAVRETVTKAGYNMKDVRGIFSIDLKAGEPGILAFCREEGLPFRCFSKEELSKAEGTFQTSAFVKEVTGIDNVCERAAVAGSEGGCLICGKSIREGVTCALALGRQGIRFD